MTEMIDQWWPSAGAEVIKRKGYQGLAPTGLAILTASELQKVMCSLALQLFREPKPNLCPMPDLAQIERTLMGMTNCQLYDDEPMETTKPELRNKKISEW